MTNAMIILTESLRLMEEGKIKPTGQKIQVEVNGETKELDCPEEIHTFQTWKECGYQVKKGEHAVAKFPIWKYTEKKKDGEDPETNMFLKTAAFFTISQCEPITGGI